jgi:hypothetical protein
MQTTLGILFGIFTCWESSEQLLDVIENFVVTRCKMFNIFDIHSYFSATK